MFLLRFVDKIGSRAFPDWAGTEVTLSEVDLLPELVEANNFERIIASSLLKEHRPDLGQQDFISAPWSAADNVRRHELWRIAQQLAEREHNAPPRCRLRRIKAEIRRQSCAGELPLKIRRVSGGQFEAFQSVWWNRDNPNELFDRCIIDPEHPFGERPSWKPNTDSWIFAPCEGIDQIVARLPAPPKLAQSLALASPPPQEPTPTTPKTLPDTPEMILSVLGLKGFQQKAIAEAVLGYKIDLPEDLAPADLCRTIRKLQTDKAKARGDKPPQSPKWDACNDFLTALRAWRANGP
jgi:hypothetical protein